MRSTLGILLLAFSACLTGCASKHNTNYSEVPPPSKQGQPSKPIVKPSNALTGKVVSFNAVGRFAILNFPITRMPAIDQKLYLYREGLRVGEVKVTGPQKDDNIVADVVNGEARPGDVVKDR
jgi:hypothetical protein